VDQFEIAEHKMDAVQLLARLTSEQREAFALHQLGFTQAEIGEMLGISQPAVYYRIQGAIKNFKRILEGDL